MIKVFWYPSSFSLCTCRFGLKAKHWTANLQLKAISNMLRSPLSPSPPQQGCAVLWVACSPAPLFCPHRLEPGRSGSRCVFEGVACTGRWKHQSLPKTSSHLVLRISGLCLLRRSEKQTGIMRKNMQDKLGKVTKHRKSTACLHLAYRCVLGKRRTG